MTTAERLLMNLRGRGFTVEVKGGKLWVRPSRKLTSAEHANIRFHLYELKVLVANPPVDSGLCPQCHVRKSQCPPFGWCTICADATWLTPPKKGTAR